MSWLKKIIDSKIHIILPGNAIINNMGISLPILPSVLSPLSVVLCILLLIFTLFFYNNNKIIHIIELKEEE